MDEKSKEELIGEAMKNSPAGKSLREAVQGAMIYANPYPLAPLLIKVIMGEMPAEEYEARVNALNQRLEDQIGKE